MQKILGKLHKIMEEADFIQKDKTNEFHNYNYASEQAIKEKLHGLLVKNKVLFTIEIESSTTVGTITNLMVKYVFWDVESGEKLEGKFLGTGEDKLDKGTYKAITGAIKYILTSTFLIPTGDDPEKEVNTPKPKYVKTLDSSPAKTQDGVICPVCGKNAVKRTGTSKLGPWEGIACPCTKGIQFIRKDRKKPEDESYVAPATPLPPEL